MDNLFPAEFQAWLELILMWVGFGTCVGLAAKAIMPGRDPGGAIATVLMGIVGAIIGCGASMFLWDERVKPISIPGVVCGTLGAVVILLFYRLFNGYIIDEAGSDFQPRRRRRSEYSSSSPRRRRRRRRSYAYED